MKQLIALIMAICIYTNALCQKKYPEPYAISVDETFVQKWDDVKHKPVANSSVQYKAEAGNIFDIQDKITFKDSNNNNETGYIIKFWNFKSNGSQKNNGDKALEQHTETDVVKLIKNCPNGDLYYIKEADFTDRTTKNFRAPTSFFKIDALVLPIKLRFKNKQPGGIFDFTQSISIGPTVAQTWNYGGPFGDKSLSILFGLNITNVPVDEKTVQNAVSSKTTLLGLSPVIGLNYEYHGVSFGLMSGLDILAGDAGQKWAYRKSPWLGISIGTSLFSPGTKTNSN